ncbi:MAG: exopolyphosphatase [Chitinophagaceae bacterium]
MRLAAIDIGSNAVRLLINEITTYKDGSFDYTKINFLRIPLRLGLDVFDNKYISESKIVEMVDTMKAFSLLMKVYGVKDYKAFATSAMRDAENQTDVLKRISKEAQIEVEVITGSQEAQLLFDTHMADYLDPKNDYLYIDVGGGSTEITFYKKGKIEEKHSFNIGTLRILKQGIDEDLWEKMREQIKNISKKSKQLTAIGSGGNINKVLSLLKRKNDKPLSADVLKNYYKDLQALSIEERMHKYKLKEDRADVIVPALQIYNAILRWGSITEIYVPQFGLVDGIVRKLYLEKHVVSMMGLKKKRNLK